MLHLFSISHINIFILIKYPNIHENTYKPFNIIIVCLLDSCFICRNVTVYVIYVQTIEPGLFFWCMVSAHWDAASLTSKTFNWQDNILDLWKMTAVPNNVGVLYLSQSFTQNRPTRSGIAPSTVEAHFRHLRQKWCFGKS